MDSQTINDLLAAAEQGIQGYLDDARSSGRIDEQSYEQAKANTFPQLTDWMNCQRFAEVSPSLREGLKTTIEAQEWEKLVNAYRQQARFGTGGIRGMMGFDRDSIVKLKEQGFDAPILKGPNTINELVLLLASAGVAKFGRDQDPQFKKVVIGYDSRVRGFDFGSIVAQLFLAYDYTVYFFDEPCPYPEVTYAIPCDEIKSDIGILISASHNDYRYNGYKLSCGNGSQFDPEQRDEMYNKYIANVVPDDIKLCSFADARPDQLVFLGGSEPVDTFDYHGREGSILNVHEKHANHVKSFLLIPDLADQQAAAESPLKVGYCAYHGAGRIAVPRMLRDIGINDIQIVTKDGLFELDGLFPSFEWRAGMERQPDPGDERAAMTAVQAYKDEHGNFDEVDILIGTDPDADRCGVVVKVPEDQRHLFDGREWALLTADDVWTLLLWYRFQKDVEANGSIQDADKQFIVLSHTTCDSITSVARKHGVGVIKTWVGFAALSAAVRDVWENVELTDLVEGRASADAKLCHPFILEYQDMAQGQRSINIAAMEQSNGFSILGGPPPDPFSLGEGGHVRDKDGCFAAILVAEIAAWAKSQGTTLFELIDKHVYLDPDIGLFVNYYEPDPLDGEYPGIEGDRKKKEILGRALDLYKQVNAGEVEIGGLKVTDSAIYRTGKYDAIYPPTEDFEFPDEGIRLYFGDKFNHATIRPSGTGNSLRFHCQLHTDVDESNLVDRKASLRASAKGVVDHLRELLGAPRN